MSIDDAEPEVTERQAKKKRTKKRAKSQASYYYRQKEKKAKADEQASILNEIRQRGCWTLGFTRGMIPCADWREELATARLLLKALGPGPLTYDAQPGEDWLQVWYRCWEAMQEQYSKKGSNPRYFYAEYYVDENGHLESTSQGNDFVTLLDKEKFDGTEVSDDDVSKEHKTGGPFELRPLTAEDIPYITGTRPKPLDPEAEADKALYAKALNLAHSGGDLLGQAAEDAKRQRLIDAVGTNAAKFVKLASPEVSET